MCLKALKCFCPGNYWLNIEQNFWFINSSKLFAYFIFTMCRFCQVTSFLKSLLFPFLYTSKTRDIHRFPKNVMSFNISSPSHFLDFSSLLCSENLCFPKISLNIISKGEMETNTLWHKLKWPPKPQWTPKQWEQWQSCKLQMMQLQLRL